MPAERSLLVPERLLLRAQSLGLPDEAHQPALERVAPPLEQLELRAERGPRASPWSARASSSLGGAGLRAVARERARDVDPSFRSRTSACSTSATSRRARARLPGLHPPWPPARRCCAWARSACWAAVSCWDCCSSSCSWLSSSACCCSSAACCCSSSDCSAAGARPSASCPSSAPARAALAATGPGFSWLSYSELGVAGVSELDGDEERAVVADTEARRHQVVGLPLGGRLRRRRRRPSGRTGATETG